MIEALFSVYAEQGFYSFLLALRLLLQHYGVVIVPIPIPISSYTL